MPAKFSSCLLRAFFLLGISAPSDSSPLQARKVENRLSCKGDVPRDLNLWPAGRAPWQFFESRNEAQTLCKAFENDGINVGCFCVSDIGPVRCLESNSTAPDLVRAFRAFCQGACTCPNSFHGALLMILGSDEESEDDIESDEASDEESDEASDEESDDEEAESEEEEDGENRPDDFVREYSSIIGDGGNDHIWGIGQDDQYTGAQSDRLQAYAIVQALRQRRAKLKRPLSTSRGCHGKCSNSYSSCGSNPNCQCKANPVDGFGAGNPAFYLSSCVSVQTRLGGKVKRELIDWPCPCNASYVSQACCEAEQGLVWEPRDLKRGVLALEVAED